MQKYRKKKRIIKASLIYLNKSIIFNLKILSTKNYSSINNFSAYKCYELLLSKGINILSLKMLTILIYIYVHCLCQIWHVFAIISSKISCPFLSLLLGIALWVCWFFWSIPLFSETIFYSFLSLFLGLYILNWHILRFTVVFFSSASLNLLFIHFSEFYTLYIWFIYLCPGIKLLEVYCTQGKSGSLRRAPPLRSRRFLCKMKAISKQWKDCAFCKWAKQLWAVRKHDLLLGAGQDRGGPV